MNKDFIIHDGYANMCRLVGVYYLNPAYQQRKSVPACLLLYVEYQGRIQDVFQGGVQIQ
jgi:hypothetical protein